MSIPPYPFYFVRHGETDWNVMNLIMGHKDIPLNEKGIEQSYQIKILLKDLEFERLWSSPLQRARQTAEIINETFNYPIEIKSYLKERGWGVGEGESHDRFLPDMKPNFRDKEVDEEKIPEGAENYRDFKARVILAFQEILISTQPPPLIVSHGGVFWVLTTLLAQTTLPADNCSLYLFRPPERKSHPWLVTNIREDHL